MARLLLVATASHSRGTGLKILNLVVHLLSIKTLVHELQVRNYRTDRAASLRTVHEARVLDPALVQPQKTLVLSKENSSFAKCKSHVGFGRWRLEDRLRQS